jgi:hypothetical protein
VAGGRPSDYTPEIVDAICERLIEGESLVQICRYENMPGYSTIMGWLNKHAEFADKYARAREAQADYLADDIIRIADESEDAQKARLQVDARKWKASKLAPKKYGDKLDLSATHNVGDPILNLLTRIAEHGRSIHSQDQS